MCLIVGTAIIDRFTTPKVAVLFIFNAGTARSRLQANSKSTAERQLRKLQKSALAIDFTPLNVPYDIDRALNHDIQPFSSPSA